MSAAKEVDYQEIYFRDIHIRPIKEPPPNTWRGEVLSDCGRGALTPHEFVYGIQADG